MNNIFDSHAHYDSERFDADRDSLLAELPGKGVQYIMNAATNLNSAEQCIDLAKRHAHLYCAVGVHPHDAKDTPVDLEVRLTALAEFSKVRAIGEIGLDYHYDFSPRERQMEVFEWQLALAATLDLPVIVHDRDAHEDTLKLLQRYHPKGVVHCFSGSVEMAREIVKLGMYLGFTGVVTFKNARRALEVVAAVETDRLLVETDCPYMAPEPFRGKRCDSSMLTGVVEAIAAVKGIQPQEFADISCQNAKALFRIL